MLNLKTLTALLLAGSAILASAMPTEDNSWGDDHKDHKDNCPTCDPTAGKNHCDITTSCISTGHEFHCACRAGYKAADPHKSFRLPFKNYEFLVFVPENTPCDTLCNDWTLPPPDLCKEVKLRDQCPV